MMQQSSAMTLQAAMLVICIVGLSVAVVQGQDMGATDSQPILAVGEPTCIWTPASYGNTTSGRCSLSLLFGAVPLAPEGLGGKAIAGVAYLAAQCAQHSDNSTCIADVTNSCTWSTSRSACQLAGSDVGITSVLSLLLACNGSAAADIWRCKALGTTAEQCAQLSGCALPSITNSSGANSTDHPLNTTNSTNSSTSGSSTSGGSGDANSMCAPASGIANASAAADMATYNVSAWGDCRGAGFLRTAAGMCAAHSPDAAICIADGRCRWQAPAEPAAANGSSSSVDGGAGSGNSSSTQAANATGTGATSSALFGSCTFSDETLVSVVLSDNNLAPGADDFTLQYQDALHSCSAMSSAAACQSYGTFYGELSRLQQYAVVLGALAGGPMVDATAGQESGAAGNATVPFCGDGICGADERCQECLNGNCTLSNATAPGPANSSVVPCATDCGWCPDPAFTEHLAQLSHFKVHHHGIAAITSPSCTCREASALCKGGTRSMLFNFTLPADFDPSQQCFVEVEMEGRYDIRSTAGRTTVLLLGSSNSSTNGSDSTIGSDSTNGSDSTSSLSPLEVLLLAGAQPQRPQSNATAGKGPFWPDARQANGTATSWSRGHTAVPCAAGAWGAGAQEVVVAFESPCIDLYDVAVHVQLWWANATLNGTGRNSSAGSSDGSSDGSSGNSSSSPLPPEPPLLPPDQPLPLPVPSPAVPSSPAAQPLPPESTPVPAPSQPTPQHSREGPQAHSSQEAGAAGAGGSASGGSSSSSSSSSSSGSSSSSSSGGALWGVLWTMVALVTVAGVGFVAYQRYGQQWSARRYRSLKRGDHRSSLREGLHGGDIEMM